MPWSITIMVLGIVLIATIGGVLKNRNESRRHGHDGESREARLRDEAAARQSAEEIRNLKERIAVLERVITDERGSRELDREIENLRDR